MAFANCNIQQFLRDEIRSQKHIVKHSCHATTSARKVLLVAPNVTTQNNFVSERALRMSK
jgi:hypothetical protein